MIELTRDGDVFVATMNDGENRWTTAMVRAFDAVLSEVEASEGAAALVTTSADPKFFSNGLDVEWFMAGNDADKGDPRVFTDECLPFFARLIKLPVPTVCAVGGHGFGAGFMLAMCHDLRVMRADRGVLCANELEIGIAIPEPELALFSHKLPTGVFYESVQFARRWSGPEALEAGIVQHLAPPDEVRTRAVEVAQGLAHLAARRDIFAWQKERIWASDSILHGTIGPVEMLSNPRGFQWGPSDIGT